MPHLELGGVTGAVRGGRIRRRNRESGVRPMRPSRGRGRGCGPPRPDSSGGEEANGVAELLTASAAPGASRARLIDGGVVGTERDGQGNVGDSRSGNRGWKER